MSWIKRKLIKWLKEEDEPVKMSGSIGYANQVVSKEGGMLNSDATLNFTVYNAIGGKVVEFRRYDRRSDRSSTSVYIIGKDEDFGEKISKISTLEVMKD